MQAGCVVSWHFKRTLSREGMIRARGVEAQELANDSRSALGCTVAQELFLAMRIERRSPSAKEGSDASAR